MTPKNEAEMYELICRSRFDSLDQKQDKMLSILKGENGDPGLLDDVRAIKKTHKLIKAGLVFVLCGFVLQAVSAGWDWFASFFR